ncbi:MAG: hypothetical protein R3E57_02270 [Porticoccaceae bacterium]
MKSPIPFLTLSLVLLLAGCETTSQSSSSSSNTQNNSSSTTQNTPSSPSESSTESQSAESKPESQQASQASSASAAQAEETEEQAAEEQASEQQAASAAQVGQPPSGEEGEPAAATAAGGVMSDEEEISALDNQLNASFAVFEGMMGEARASGGGELAADGEDAGGAAGGTAGGGAGAGAGGPLYEEGDLAGEPVAGLPGGSGTDEQQGSGWGDGNDGSRGTVTTSYGKDGGINSTLPGGAIPDNIPNGSDDDVVARQIREAAMNEKDPALREKLWEEYRKYKQGQ